MMLPIAALLLGLATATPDDPEVELATVLARRGWIDLAVELCVRIEKLPGAVIARAEVASARARKAPDSVSVARELDPAIAALAGLKTLDERGMAGYLRVQKAALLGDSPEAVKAWQDAIAFFQGSIAALKAMPDGQAVEEALLDARLELPKAMAALARLSAADPASRKQRLDEALRLFLDFQFDTGTRPIAFEAILEEGRVRSEAKDYARAERCFRSVMTLKAKGPGQGPYVTSLQESAFLNLLRTQTLAGRWRDAIAAADGFLKEPGRANTRLGLAVQLAKAEAMAAGDDRPGAILLAQAIAGADPNGTMGIAARDRIREWTRDGKATAAQLLLIADGLMDRGLYREALVDLRRCVEASKDPQDRTRFEPVASFKRGECFRALQRDVEASLAYQEVFRRYPKHELAERAAFEAVRALIRSAASTRDRRDEEQQEALLQEIEDRGVQGRFADFFSFLRAEILERKGKWSAAADLYQTVGENCDVHTEALVSAAHCLRREVEAKGDPKRLQGAETLLRRAVGLLEKSPQPRLMAVAQFELATVLLHDSMRRPKEALEFILRCASLIPAESEMLPRLGEMEIRARLGMGDVPGAAARLDQLLAAPAGGAAAIRGLRRVAVALEAADPAKAARYYRVWLDRAATEDTSSGDVRIVADGLYHLAREMNRFDSKTASVLDLRGKPLLHQGIWKDAAEAQQRLLAVPGLSAAERSAAQSRRICCEGLGAASPADWARVKAHGDEILRESKLVDASGLNPKVLQTQGWLAGVYLEYGHALYQLGKAGQKFQFGNALSVFADIVSLSERGSEPWWVCQAMILRIRFDRGEAGDIDYVDGALSLLEKNHPDFDEGRYGIRGLLTELRDQVHAVRGPRK
jgi:tetratricopeptide (TPR) repeat protein